jgi:hypothetical protein
MGPITGVFLNAINDPNNGLPSGGPGRFEGNRGGPVGKGNFNVTEFTADVSRPNNPDAPNSRPGPGLRWPHRLGTAATEMNRRTALALGLLVLGISSAQATELPLCNDRDVVTILVDIGRKNPPHSPYYVSNIRELGMNPSKRFCEGQFSVFILPPNIRAFGHTEYSRRTYTIEWMNEEEGRFWVQLQ